MISSCVVFLASTSPASLPPLMTRLETLKNTEMQILQEMLSDIKTKETKNETLE